MPAQAARVRFFVFGMRFDTIYKRIAGQLCPRLVGTKTQMFAACPRDTSGKSWAQWGIE